MFKNTLDNKPLYKNSDDIEFRDLTQTIFEMQNKNFVKYDVYRVPKEYRMRPDLIAKSVYNDTQFTEIILKFNGISNPFSINEGDIILIPDLDSATKKIRITGDGTKYNKDEELRKSYKYIDPLKAPKKGEKLVNFNNRNFGQVVEGAENALPPNFAPEGTSQITYRDGRVFFGAGVNTCLKNGITSGEFLSSINKNKKSK